MPENSILTAVYTDRPVDIRGKLDHPIWQKAQAYPFSVVTPSASTGRSLAEGGYVQLAWDHDFLYVAARLEDSDVVAENDQDHTAHFSTGDVVEVFLKPPGRLYFWELYGTPNGRKTCYFFPSRGRGWLPSASDDPIDLSVAATIDGILNDWQSRDRGWTIEFAISIGGLMRHGDEFGTDAAPWSILIGRYNYSAYLDVNNAETSSVPGLPDLTEGRFNSYEYWADLHLVH